jgi:2-oxoglutarate dehydrogenase E2 component (dihydrolipoamide succinyltransferase)
MPNLDVKIPPMGESITSGILAKWQVKDGDIVKKDQTLFELETDKITSESTAETAGKITLKVAAGDEVKIGQVVATIDPSAAADAAAQISDLKPQIADPGAPPAKPKAKDAEPATPKSQISELKSQIKAPPAPPSPTPPIAQISDLKSQINKPVPDGARQTRRKLTPLRQRIAERLVAAQHEGAMLTTFNEVDMSAIMAIRAKYQDDFVKKNGLKLGFMSFFVKAVVQALKEVPAVNAQLDGDTLVENHFYDIGVAVSTERGLMVPVIRDCATLGMAAIVKAIAGLAAKARDGKITLTDLEGGVFTITNLGAFGIEAFTPIINFPETAVLGLGAIRWEVVALENGHLATREQLTLSLTFDHRVVDGAPAARFLQTLATLIESPPVTAMV